MMKPITNIVLDFSQNTLHEEECWAHSLHILEYFSKSQTQSEIEFLYSIISHLVNVENNLIFEVCPECLGKKFDLLEDFNNLF